jgi:hypothetical protein
VFYTKGIVRHNSSVYFGEWRDGRHPPRRLPKLYDIKRAETDGRGHEVQSSWTLAPKQGCYIKTPSLFDYAGAPDVERRILRELQIKTPADSAQRCMHLVLCGTGWKGVVWLKRAGPVQRTGILFYPCFSRGPPALIMFRCFYLCYLHALVTQATLSARQKRSKRIIIRY